MCGVCIGGVGEEGKGEVGTATHASLPFSLSPEKEERVWGEQVKGEEGEKGKMCRPQGRLRAGGRREPPALTHTSTRVYTGSWPVGATLGQALEDPGSSPDAACNWAGL